MQIVYGILLIIFIICMCFLCRYSDIAKVISLFLILLLLQTVKYSNTDYSNVYIILCSLGDIILYSILFMAIPLIFLVIKYKKLKKEESKKICKWNSICIWIGSIIITTLLQSYNINISFNTGWLAPIIYYYINYYIITEKDIKNETDEIEILE